MARHFFGKEMNEERAKELIGMLNTRLEGYDILLEKSDYLAGNVSLYIQSVMFTHSRCVGNDTRRPRARSERLCHRSIYWPRLFENQTERREVVGKDFLAPVLEKGVADCGRRHDWNEASATRVRQLWKYPA